MEPLLERCTSFIIAHRLSTIRKTDRILVIEAGQIAEMGTHAELLRIKKKYFQLYTQQFRQQKEIFYNQFFIKPIEYFRFRLLFFEDFGIYQ